MGKQNDKDATTSNVSESAGEALAGTAAKPSKEERMRELEAAVQAFGSKVTSEEIVRMIREDRGR